MQSQNINYIPALDHLRFFAAILIVIFHLANGELVHYLHFDIGVPLFFTLSGYLFFTIAYNHKNEQIHYWKFIYNRILRIYPLVTLLFLMAIVIMDNFVALDFINLLGLNFPGRPRDSWIVGDWGYNKHLSFNWWTIGVEFTFYLLFPIIFKLYRQYGTTLLLKLLFVVIIFKLLLYYSLLEEYGWKKLDICFHYSFFGNFDIFIIGMIVAHYANQEMQNKLLVFALSSKITLASYVTLMWILLISYKDSLPFPLSTSFVAILCSALIVFYQKSFANAQESYALKALSTLGSMSFSIYLLHDFIKSGLQGLGVEKWFLDTFLTSAIHDQEVTKFCLLVLYIPIILVISKLSFNVIEYPFLSMRVKYFIKG